MGLSSFNAMRARMKAEAEALNKGAKVEVKETSPEISVAEAKKEKVEETLKEDSKTRKTDAEKLKKKKE